MVCGARLYVPKTQQLIVLDINTDRQTDRHRGRVRNIQQSLKHVSTVGTYAEKDFCLRLVVHYLTERTVFARRSLHSCCLSCVSGKL